MSPSTLARFPVSDALKLPRGIILPPPCFTVGTVFFGSRCLYLVLVSVSGVSVALVHCHETKRPACSMNNLSPSTLRSLLKVLGKTLKT